MHKLFVIVRSDLPPGAQAVQLGHALSAFAVEHTAAHREWHVAGKNLVYLAVPDRPALEALLARAVELDVYRASFVEPDFGDTLTAIALGSAAEKLVSSLPLALKDRRDPQTAQALAVCNHP